MAAEALTREHPLREEGWRLLAMSLYAGGRQADALDALRRARDILAEELGMDPGPALLQVETDVLRQRLAIARPPVHETRSPADPAAEHDPYPGPGFLRRRTRNPVRRQRPRHRTSSAGTRN